MTNLSHVPFMELVEELRNRSRAMILLTAVPKDGKPDQQDVTYVTKFTAWEGYGMLKQLEHHVKWETTKMTGLQL